MICIELFYLESEDTTIAAIRKHFHRDKHYFRVTPASRARLGMYVFRRLDGFTVTPFVTGCVGWTAWGITPIPQKKG